MTRRACTEDGWDAKIEAIYDHRALQRSTQRIYRIDGSRRRHRARTTPPSCTLVRVRSRTLPTLTPAARSIVESKISTFWDSHLSFFRSGICYAALEDSNLASICISGFVADRTHVIDIETQQAFQRRGYAYVVGRAFVDECSRTGLAPHWDCMDDNIASIALAEKLGFALDRSYSLYSFSLDRETTTGPATPLREVGLHL